MLIPAMPNQGQAANMGHSRAGKVQNHHQRCACIVSACTTNTPMHGAGRLTCLPEERVPACLPEGCGRVCMHGAAYYRGAMGILLVYDVTDETSFNNIRNWMRNIEQHASDNVNKARPSLPPIPHALHRCHPGPTYVGSTDPGTTSCPAIKPRKD